MNELYRHYDAAGQLLYVGVSLNDPPGRQPTYVVLANCGTGRDRLVEIGLAWDSVGKTSKRPYVDVVLNARPWGEWDGRLQLHRIEEDAS